MQLPKALLRALKWTLIIATLALLAYAAFATTVAVSLSLHS